MFSQHMDIRSTLHYDIDIAKNVAKNDTLKGMLTLKVLGPI